MRHVTPSEIGAAPHPRPSTRRRPGPPPKRAADLAESSEAARFYIGYSIAEAAVLPLCECKDESEKAAWEKYIATQLGLFDAQRQGIITRWLVIWNAGKYPKTPRTVRLFGPHGKYIWRELLGKPLFENLKTFTENLQRPQGKDFPEEDTP